MKKTKKLLSVFFAFVMLFSITSAVPLTAEAASLPKTSISTLTAYPAGFTVYFTKQKKVTGYQIQYSTSSSFKNAQTVRTTNTSSAVRNKASAKKYYVRVRTYKKSGKKYTYSAWSAKKTVTTLNKNASDPAHIKSIKAGHASFTVTAYTSKNATKYQARYSTNKNMSGYKTTTSSSSTIKVTGRTEKKTYYVQTRTYKTVKGKKYYSNWSPTKTVKTQAHNYSTPVYSTRQVLVKAAYDEPIYEQKPVMKEMQCFYCGGCHVDCILEAQRLGYANYQAFHVNHELGRNGLSCPNTYGDKGAMISGASCGLPTSKVYQMYNSDGTPKYETVQTGTKHHDAEYKTEKYISAYKCSCGATKKA